MGSLRLYMLSQLQEKINVLLLEIILYDLRTKKAADRDKVRTAAKDKT